MAWNYLHFNMNESELEPSSAQIDGESALQTFLNRYGAIGWELVFCDRANDSYELIFRSERTLLGG